MSHKHHPNRASDEPDLYQIILQGHLSSQRSAWFDSFTITQDQCGQTILVGPVIDQAALHGLLKKIRDLGIPLVSLNRLDRDEEVTSL